MKFIFQLSSADRWHLSSMINNVTLHVHVGLIEIHEDNHEDNPPGHLLKIDNRGLNRSGCDC